MKLVSVAVIVALIVAACEMEEGETKSESSYVKNKNSQQSGAAPSRTLLTPDNYSKQQAKTIGYTIIHEDTGTSADDERCGTGGGRYSRSGKSMCQIFTDTDDWYSSSRAANTNCPSGFTRVDQAGIGRAHLAGSTRQCRTTQKITTTDERAHYYCPHGSNLVGLRSGASAGRYGVCRLKCDPDTRHLYSSSCGGSSKSTPTTSRPTPTTVYTPSYTPPAYTPTTRHIPRTTVPRTTIPQPDPENPVILTPGRIPRPAPPGTPPGPDLDGFVLPTPALKLAPDQDGLHIVGIDTWFWISSEHWGEQTVSQPKGGYTYTVTAKPTELKVIVRGPTDRASAASLKRNAECERPSARLQSPQIGRNQTFCSYEWTNAGIYEVSSEVVWELKWTCQPNCGSSQPSAPHKRTSQSKAQSVAVSEAQAIIVS